MATVISRFEGAAVVPIAALVGGLGAGAVGIGLWVDPERALFSYLAAYAWAVSIAVGALILMQISYAANFRWPAVVRRLHEVVSAAVTPLALLFLPLALGLAYVYVWADPPPGLSAHLRALIEHKRPYLNIPFFLIRTGLYFAVWIAAAELLGWWSRRREREAIAAGRPEPTPIASDLPDAHPRHGGDDAAAFLARERAFSAATLPLVGLALTFAAFDWLMSLQPAWYSSIFGVYFFAGGFLAGIALIACLTYGGFVSGSLAGWVTPSHFHALGRLLLGFTVFWAYAAFFQAFLIQIADKPEEVTFYLDRIGGSWGAFLSVLLLGHFVAPFFLLLRRSVKFRPRYVAAVASWILVFHYLDLYWLVLPVHSRGGFAPHWLDLAALAAVGGITTAVCAWRLRGAPLLAVADPFLHDGVRYASPT